MKKLIAAALFSLLFAGTMAAQGNDGLVNSGTTTSQNVISLSVGVFNKIRIKYERALTESISVGAFGNAYYGLYPGFRIDPFLRVYISESAPEGFYVQLKALAGSFTSSETFKSIFTGGQEELKMTFQNYGGGIGIGYEFISGRNRNLAIDLGIGIKRVSPLPDYTNNSYHYAGDNAVFYTTGPGSVFDGLISIGAAF